jgi:hypothetical protein
MDLQGYVIDFDKDMTLKYKDAEGFLKFVFEPGPSKTPKVIRLNRLPLTSDYKDVPISGSNSARLELAFTRARQYLEKCGYEVVVVEE